jgi:hypothetical protein
VLERGVSVFGGEVISQQWVLGRMAAAVVRAWWFLCTSGVRRVSVALASTEEIPFPLQRFLLLVIRLQRQRVCWARFPPGCSFTANCRTGVRLWCVLGRAAAVVVYPC